MQFDKLNKLYKNKIAKIKEKLYKMILIKIIKHHQGLKKLMILLY